MDIKQVSRRAVPGVGAALQEDPVLSRVYRSRADERIVPRVESARGQREQDRLLIGKHLGEPVRDLSAPGIESGERDSHSPPPGKTRERPWAVEVTMNFSFQSTPDGVAPITAIG
jgi:hypothetical protein